jgi:alkyl hydroperoxide reductase 1
VEWKGKKVVIVSVPGKSPRLSREPTADRHAGAFTPGCQARHLPPYIQRLSELRAKGVDIVAFIATNDAFVMSAWGKVNKVVGDDIVWSPYSRRAVLTQT